VAVADDDYGADGATTVSLSAGAAGGLAGLLIGLALLVSACALMVFNVFLFGIGLRGIPIDIARIGGAIGVVGVAALGVVGVVVAIRAWSAAARNGESVALGGAGTAAAVVGLVGWLIAGIDLLAILGLFA
jgi:hypothetical protein